MLREAVNTEAQFAEDLLAGARLSLRDMRQYLGYVADSRLQRLGISPVFNAKNPFSFMDLRDVQELHLLAWTPAQADCLSVSEQQMAHFTTLCHYEGALDGLSAGSAPCRTPR